MMNRIKQNIRRARGGTTVKSKAYETEASEENFLENGRHLLEESISLFDGKTNPIRCLSIEELKTMKHNSVQTDDDCYKSMWEGRIVLVKNYPGSEMSAKQQTIRDIVVATQMGTHKNVQKLLGCCLHTKCPVVVYEWPENGSLETRILHTDKDTSPLEWKDRLRIAWEISCAMSYLHYAFQRPIIHRDLKPCNVLLGTDNAAKLLDFSLSVLIPEGKEYVDDEALCGTYGYVAPECIMSGRVAESTDVFSFGIFFLVLLTGKAAILRSEGDIRLDDWVRESLENNHIIDILDPAITANRPTTDENLVQHFRNTVELAFRCVAEPEDRRPTMKVVANELKDMMNDLKRMESAC